MVNSLTFRISAGDSLHSTTYLLSELSWLAEGRSCARLESVVELCAGSAEDKWEGGAGAPLVLMFRGDSGFGVEDADEAEKKGKMSDN